MYPDSNIWFAVGDGMLLLVKHLFSRNDKYFENAEIPVKKKMLTRETTRVYQAIHTPKDLGLIPVDFKEMLQGIENPIISKKIF